MGSSQKAEDGSLQHVVNEVRHLKQNFVLVSIPWMSVKACLFTQSWVGMSIVKVLIDTAYRSGSLTVILSVRFVLYIYIYILALIYQYIQWKLCSVHLHLIIFRFLLNTSKYWHTSYFLPTVLVHFKTRAARYIACDSHAYLFSEDSSVISRKFASVVFKWSGI